MYLKEVGISKHSWKKIRQLLWTFVTYLLENVEHGIEYDVESASCNLHTFLNGTSDSMNTL